VIARGLGASVAADGFSRPYVMAACYASWLYGMLGLLLVHRALVRFGGSRSRRRPGPRRRSSGHPLLYYVTLGPGFSHAVSLFVIALLLWLTLRYRGHELTLGRAALLGAPEAWPRSCASRTACSSPCPPSSSRSTAFGTALPATWPAWP
jgi:hypothetical protein